MTMDAKRFGLGAVLGLLAAAAIVAGSGLALAPMRSPSSSPWNAVTTIYSLATTTYVTSTTGANGTSGSSASGSAVTTRSTTTPLSSLHGAATLPSSMLSAVGYQSPASNAILLVPVLAAAALGLIIYRATGRKNDSDGEASE
jgi:hypothetical protein